MTIFSREYAVRILSPLLGATIKEINVSPEDDGDYVGLLVELPDKTEKVVWFLQDEEGNAPGGFQVQNV